MKGLYSTTVGVLLLALLGFSAVRLAGQPWPGGATLRWLRQQTPDAAPCLSAGDQGFTFEVPGYRANDDGTHTLTYRVTNAGQHDVSHVAFGTAGWTRLAPADGSAYRGEPGNYQVAWTNDRGNPGFVSVKFTPQFGGFSAGASDIFTLVVRDFDPDETVQLQAKAGGERGTVSFRLSDGPCDRTPPAPTPTPFFSPLPTPTATPAGYTLPAGPVIAACVFTPPPGGVPDEPLIPLDAYSFAAPQVVLTNTAPIGIQQWLPDSETLLVTRESRSNQLVSAGLVNTSTGGIAEIVEPRAYLREPKWLSANRTVAWQEFGPFQDESFNINQPGYWIRSLDPPAERRLSDDGRSGWSIAHDVSPDGKQVVFMALPGGTQPLMWNQESKAVRALPVDLANWRYQKPNVLYPLRPFNVHWQPSGEKILFEDGIWLFLYNLTTNRGCEIDMHTLSPHYPSVHEAGWSPNGRYLLLKIALDPPYTSFRGPNGLVLVLDTYTGETVHYSPSTAVYGFTWAPDSQMVAMTGLTGQKIGRFDMHGIYLLNIQSGEYRQILSERDVANVAWSPDGTRLAFQCHNFESVTYVDRICVSQVSLIN